MIKETLEQIFKRRNKTMSLMKKIIIAAVTLIIILSVISLAPKSEKPAPYFQNGEIVVHTLSGRKGQIIDNAYQYNRKSECWRVSAKMVDPDQKGSVLLGKITGMITENFNEFELRKEE
ncbi:MAG: hypothetical protein ACTSSP_00820 [Candidatus Asgardarchaeia archaeon]